MTKAPAVPSVAERTLVVWCPDWPLVAAGIPPSIPAAAFHANRVVACTKAARAEGVGRGLRRREAQARCPGLVVEPHDPHRDARAFEPVAAVIETFVPRLEITRPGACALPTRGPSRYFGGDEALAGLIRKAVDAVLAGLPGWGPDVACRVGIAEGPFAALLAARRALVVPPGGTAGFLAPLPVSLLDEPELTDLLLRLGIDTLGAFAALPADEVIGRFGPVGAAAHRRARGLDDRDLTCREPPPDLAVQVVLDPPADRVDTAAFAAKAIADGLCRSLAEGGLVCTCIRIETETEHGEQFGRTWRHHRAFTPATVAERVRWQLEGWLAERTRCGCPPPGHDDAPCPGGVACPNPVGGTTGGLTLLRVVPEQVDRDGGHQVGFWGGSSEADDRAARGLARIQGILGPEAVVTAVLGGGRGPGEQIRLVPWGEPREPARPGAPGPSGTDDSTVRNARPRRQPRRQSGQTGRTTSARAGTRVRTSGRSPSATERPVWPGRIPSPAPAVVPVTPPPAELVDRDGDILKVTSRSLLSGEPASFSIAGGSWERVTAWAGPWTADERWWDPAAHRRRARLQIVTDAGAAYLLALEAGRWRVEATYD